MAEQKELCGVLFRNHRKERDAQPDYTGNCKVRGEVYYLSAWIKDGPNGKFFSLALTERVTNARNEPVTSPKENENGG